MRATRHAPEQIMGRLVLGLVVSLMVAGCHTSGDGSTALGTGGSLVTSSTGGTGLGGAGGTAPPSSSSSSGSSSSSSSSSSSGACSADASGPVSLRALFIGNSYTYVNDLPGQVQALAASSCAAHIDVDSVAVGGATLADQVNSTGAMAKIQQGGWTHVVLQGQSEEPLDDPAGFESAAATLAGAATAVGAKVVFYETWARAAGDADYQQSWSGGTPAGMQAGLRAEYQKVAAVNGGVVAPAGDAWEKTLAQLPSLTLFQADGSHPTVPATYLVACVFFGTLTDESPLGIPDPPSGVSAQDAASLQGIAMSVLP